MAPSWNGTVFSALSVSREDGLYAPGDILQLPNPAQFWLLVLPSHVSLSPLVVFQRAPSKCIEPAGDVPQLAHSAQRRLVVLLAHGSDLPSECCPTWQSRLCSTGVTGRSAPRSDRKTHVRARSTPYCGVIMLLVTSFNWPTLRKVGFRYDLRMSFPHLSCVSEATIRHNQVTRPV